MILNIEIPDTTGLTEEEVKKWVLVLVERKENHKLQPPKADLDAAKARIEEYKTKNNIVLDDQEVTQP